MESSNSQRREPFAKKKKNHKLVRGEKGLIAFLQHVYASGTIWEAFPLNTFLADAGGQQISLGLTRVLAGDTAIVRMRGIKERG